VAWDLHESWDESNFDKFLGLADYNRVFSKNVTAKYAAKMENMR
jgi:hypothetical protein